MFAQPPPAQNQQQPLFDAFGTNTTHQQPVAAPAPASSGSFDFFAPSSAAATSTSSATDFFSMSSTPSQPASSFSSTANIAGLIFLICLIDLSIFCQVTDLTNWPRILNYLYIFKLVKCS